MSTAATSRTRTRSAGAWADLDPAAFDAPFLPGGHAPGMRQYLGSHILREQVAKFWDLGRPVGAICHCVLVLARTPGADGRSIIADRQTTCLPRCLERTAYYSTAWRLGRYYRTYSAYVADEVRAAPANPTAQFRRGPLTLTARGTATNDRPAFVAQDGNYLSARWPGDAYLFARRFLAMLQAPNDDTRTPAPTSHLAQRMPRGRPSLRHGIRRHRTEYLAPRSNRGSR